MTDSPPGRGRAREARRNDKRILEAAKTVLGSDPRATMAQIAAEADVGIGALYSRYPSKQALVLELLEEGVALFDREIDRAQRRLDDGDEPGTAYADLLAAVVAANVHTLSRGNRDVLALQTHHQARWNRLVAKHQLLLDRVLASRGLRAGLTLPDVGLLLRAVNAVQGANPERTTRLRLRVLRVMLDGLDCDLPPLPAEDSPDDADYRST